MPEPSKPALTPAEWADLLTFTRLPRLFDKAEWGEDENLDPKGISLEHFFVESKDFKAGAAILLYGQPFGFTREHVDGIRNLVDLLEAAVRERTDREVGVDSEEFPDGLALATSEETRAVDAALEAADRLEALLPPVSDGQVTVK